MNLAQPLKLQSRVWPSSVLAGPIVTALTTSPYGLNPVRAATSRMVGPIIPHLKWKELVEMDQKQSAAERSGEIPFFLYISPSQKWASTKGLFLDTFRFKEGARWTRIGIFAIGLCDLSSSSRFLCAEGISKRTDKKPFLISFSCVCVNHGWKPGFIIWSFSSGIFPWSNQNFDMPSKLSSENPSLFKAGGATLWYKCLNQIIYICSTGQWIAGPSFGITRELWRGDRSIFLYGISRNCVLRSELQGTTLSLRTLW